MHSESFLKAIVLSLASLLIVSCSSGSNGPQPGTPGFYWIGARETFTQGDYLKTMDNLDRAMKGAEYTARARPWSLVVTSGLVRGYMDLADSYEIGAKAARTKSSAFRKQVMDLRRYARVTSLQYVENLRAFVKSNPEPQVTLAFPFPSGSAAEPPTLSKITSGLMPLQADVDVLQRAVLSRAVILQTSLAAGAGDDSAKAQEMFKAGEVKVPLNDFMYAMAQSLHDQAQLYGPKKLSEPDKVALFAEEAIGAMKGVPETKEIKTFNQKLQKVLKDAKKSS